MSAANANTPQAMYTDRVNAISYLWLFIPCYFILLELATYIILQALTTLYTVMYVDS